MQMGANGGVRKFWTPSPSGYQTLKAGQSEVKSPWTDFCSIVTPPALRPPSTRPPPACPPPALRPPSLTPGGDRADPGGVGQNQAEGKSCEGKCLLGLKGGIN